MTFFGPPDIPRLKAKRKVPALIRALRYQNEPGVRRDAAKALGCIGDARAVAPLLTVLGDRDLSVRGNAVEALGLIGDAEAVEPLVAVFRVKSAVPVDFAAIQEARVAELAVKALTRIGPGAVDVLVVALAEKDADVHERAGRALAEMGDARAVEALVTALGDKSSFVRRRAATVLGEIGDSQAAGPLLAALQDKVGFVRAAAASALDGVGWQPDASEAAIEFWIAKKEPERCGGIGPLAVAPLIKILTAKDDKLADGAVRGLARIGSPAIEALLVATGHASRLVRRRAASALGKIGDARAVDALVAALGDKNSGVRRSAVEALAKIGDAGAVDNLLAALGEKDGALAEGAVRGLASIGSSVLEALVTALGDTSGLVRRRAARALGLMEDAGAVKPLVMSLEDGEVEVRREAALALGSIGDAQAVEPLVAALGDRARLVRKSAAEALGLIGNARATDALLDAVSDKKPEVCLAAAEALDGVGWRPDSSPAAAAYWVAKGKPGKCVAIGSPAVPALLTALRSENQSLLKTAAKASGSIGDARAVRPLVAALKNRNMQVRRAAARALVEIYATGTIDEEDRQHILPLRGGIIEPHTDWMRRVDTMGRAHRDKDCDIPGGHHVDSRHEDHNDRGIGVPFDC